MALARRWFYDFVGTQQWFWRAKETAETALRGCPWLGEPHLEIGTILLHSGDPVAATKSIRLAIAHSPSLAEAHEVLGRILSETGHLPDAARRLETAQALDPWSSVPLWEAVRTAALNQDMSRYLALLGKPLTPNGKRPGRWTNYLRFAAWQRDMHCLRDIVEEYEQAPKAANFDFGAVDAYIDVVLRAAPPQHAYEAMESRGIQKRASEPYRMLINAHYWTSTG
jgi:tetratricopeptide (TPR) repeat protein